MSKARARVQHKAWAIDAYGDGSDLGVHGKDLGSDLLMGATYRARDAARDAARDLKCVLPKCRVVRVQVTVEVVG